MRRLVLFFSFCVALLLAGCDQLTGALGIESPEKMSAARDAEGRAIGGACRHAGRAIEDCYSMNKKADKAAIFAGWRDMNDYMRENKIEAVAPQVPAKLANAKPAADEDDDAVEGAGDGSSGGSKTPGGGKSRAGAGKGHAS